MPTWSIIRSSLLLVLASASALAETPDQLAQQTILNAKLGASSNQSYCLQGGDGVIQGFQTSQPQRIASVTKLFTSLVSLNALPTDHRWQTKFTLLGKHLHISGGLDPWFEQEKVLALIAELRARGVRELDTISFDENFLFQDGEPNSYSPPTPADSAASLALYFSPRGLLSKSILARRAAAVAMMTQDGLKIPLADIGIPTKRIYFSPSNPLEGPNSTEFVHTSRTLLSTLKTMNVFSKNKIAQNLWNFVSLQNDPLKILAAEGVPTEEIQIHDGSGLYILSSNGRIDNQATCNAVMHVVDALERKAGDLHLRQEDIVSVASDPGSTLSDRFGADPAVRNAIIAKTGTLGNTSTLAGWLLGSQSLRFVILNETSLILDARNAQDAFLLGLLRNGFGPEKPITGYTPISFFPLETKFFD